MSIEVQARAEAHRRWPNYTDAPEVLHQHAVFVAGAEWQASREAEVTELDNRIAEAKEIVGPDARLADPYALGKLDGLLIAQSVLGPALGGGD